MNNTFILYRDLSVRQYVIVSALETHQCDHIILTCIMMLLQHIYSNLVTQFECSVFLIISTNHCLRERDKPTSDKQVISPHKLNAFSIFKSLHVCQILFKIFSGTQVNLVSF